MKKQKFDATYFPKFDQLTLIERFFLKTCCYFPPKKRREKNLIEIKSIEVFQKNLESAFGKNFWNFINGKRILDFGCGEGWYVLGMASKCNCIAEGIDILSNFRTAEAEATKKGIKNVNFHLGLSTVLDDESFDVIISHDSFEHFEDPEFILSEMVRLTKPGGSILIKFGPTWMGPYGRHMGGTIRKDRPWVHLLFPEKVIMRCHSVYHNKEVLFEKYSDLDGGLNKMTISKFKRILKRNTKIKIEEIDSAMWLRLNVFKHIPFLKELFASSAYAKCIRV